MYNYDDYQELGKLAFINDNIIESLNYRIRSGIPTRVTLDNTTMLDSSVLNKIIDSDLLQFRVIGGLDKEKYNTPNYKQRTTYGIRDMKHIINIFERIESTVDPNWSELERAQHIYGTLANYMEYAYNHKNEDYNVNQSLRALIGGRGICAAYSLIFKELMDRQGIKCDYVRGLAGAHDEKHAWNVLTIDGVDYPVDVTWESNAIHRNPGYKNRQQFFGVSQDFIDRHHP